MLQKKLDRLLTKVIVLHILTGRCLVAKKRGFNYDYLTPTYSEMVTKAGKHELTQCLMQTFIEKCITRLPPIK